MDAQAFAEHKKNCKMCNRKGLPILLTRYAIAPKSSHAPEVSGNFKVHKDAKGTAAPALDVNTHYTQRLLRPGYIYVYDPENGLLNPKTPWQGYVVNTKGYLTPFPVPTPQGYVVPSPQDDSEPCEPWNTEMLARCITVANPEKPNRKIWIGFSDTRWTAQVRRRNVSEAVRKRHMREFDVSAWWASTSHDHACKMDECVKHISDFFRANAEGFSFSFANFNYHGNITDYEALAKLVGIIPKQPIDNNEKDRIMGANNEKVRKGEFTSATSSQASVSITGLLQRAATRLLGEANKHKAAVVALNDPVGTLADLSLYMDHCLKKEIDRTIRPRHAWELTIANHIESLEEGVKKNYIERHIKNLRITAAGGSSTTLAAPGPGGGMAVGYATAAAMRNAKIALARYEQDPNAFIAGVENNEWERKYLPKYDPEKVKNAKINFEKDIEQFDREHILPLVKSFVDWFQSPLYVACMDCNHDPADFESGVAYATIVSFCIGPCQDKPLIVEKIIAAQVEASAKDTTMPLSRALAFNQDKIANKLEEIIESGIFKNEGFEKTLEAFGTAVDRFGLVMADYAKHPTTAEKAGRVFGALTTQIGSHIIKVSRAFSKNPVVVRSMVRLGCMTGMAFLTAKLNDNLGNYIKHASENFARHMAKSGLNVSATQIAESFEARTRSLKNQAIHTDIAFMVRPDDMQRAIKSAGPNGTLTQAQVHELTSVATNRQAGYGGIKIALLDKIADQGYFYDNKATGLREIYTPEASHAAMGAKVVGAGEQAAARADNFSRTYMGAAGNVLSGLVSYFCLMAASEEMDKTINSHDPKRAATAKWTFVGMTMSMAYSFGSVLGDIGQLRPSIAMRVPGIFGKDAMLLKFTKGLGVAAGAIFAGLDIAEFDKARQNKEFGMAALYLFSGGVGVIGAVALGVALFTASAATAAIAATVGFIFVGIGLLLTLLILYFKDDVLQDWLKRSRHGRAVKDKFTSLEQEVNVLKGIMTMPA
jgi:hypothetical protein